MLIGYIFGMYFECDRCNNKHDILYNENYYSKLLQCITSF